MKRLMHILFAFLMTGSCALAAPSSCTLSDLALQTSSGWHKTYEACGRTISVNIPIQLPDAEFLCELSAETLPLRESIPDTSHKSDGYDTENHLFFNEEGFFRIDTPSQAALRTFQRTHKDPLPPRGYDTPPVIVRLNALEADIPYTYGLSATLRDSELLMKNVLHEYFPAEDITLQPHWIHARGGLRRYDEATGTFSGDIWDDVHLPLIVYFNQFLHGVPILTSAVDAMHPYAHIKREEQGSSFFGGIAILQDVGMDEWYTSAQFTNLLRIRKVTKKEVPLCSFDTVLTVCERLIADGRLRKVDSLRLGYVVWYGTRKNEYVLKPMWVLEGELFENASVGYNRRVTEAHPSPAEYGSLLFDAQTGDFLDPLKVPHDFAYAR